MASAEELRKQAIDESNQLIGEQINLTAELADQIGFVVKQMQEKGNLDRGSVDLAREALKLTRSLAGDYSSQKDVAKEIAKNEKLRNDVKRQQIALNNQALGGLEAELEANNGNLTSEAEQYKLLQNVGKQLEANASYLEEQNRRQENISKGMGFLGRSAGGLQKTLSAMGMGEFGKKLGLDNAAAKAKEMSTRLTDGGKKSLGGFGKLKVLFGSLGAALKSALGPIALLGMIQSAYAKGEEAAKKLSEQTTGLARELGISQKQANGLMKEIKSAGGAAGMTGEMAAKSGQAIYSAIGGTEKLSKSTLSTFMKLNTFAGMSAENLADIHKFAKLTGQDAGVVAEEMAGAAQQFIKNNKLNVSMKKLMADAGKASATVKLSIKGGAAELIKAVGQSKKLGLELKQVEDIAGGLLDIEESLAAEMEAELLTGKELNLEKAREAALNNDLSTVMEEITKQGIDQESFGKMNRIQQEAIAKSIGMTRDSMAGMFEEQKKNVAAQTDLVSATEEGTKAMESTTSAAEGMSGFADKLAGMFIPVFNALRPIVELFQLMSAEILAGLVIPIVNTLAPILMKIMNTIMPPIAKVFEVISNVIGVILEALTPVFDLLVNLLNTILPPIASLFEVVGGAIGRIVEALSPAIEMITEIANMLLPLFSKYLEEFIIPQIEMVADVFATVIEAIMPIVETLLNALMPIIKQILDTVMQVADMVLPIIMDLFNKIVPIVMQLFNALRPILDTVLKVIAEQILPVVSQLLERIIPIVANLLDQMMPLIDDVLGIIVEDLLPMFADLIEQLLPPIMGIIDALMPLVTDILNVALDLLQPILGIIIDLAKQFLPIMMTLFKSIQPILDPVLSIFTGILEVVTSILTGDWEGMGNALKKVGLGIINFIISIFESIFNLAIAGINAIIKYVPGVDYIDPVDWQIEMAEGGIVTQPTKALIGEAGPEAVVPLNDDKSMNVYSSALEAKLDILIDAVTKGGDVYLDGAKVGETLALSTYRMQ